MPARKIVQDILPSKRRTIRDVALSDEPPRKNPPRTDLERAERGIRVPIHLEHVSESKRTAEPISSASSASSSSKEHKSQPREPRVAKKGGAGRNFKWLIGGIVIISCLIIAYAASMILARASVTIIPRSMNVPINGNFSAAQNAESPNLSFETISTTTIAHISEPVSNIGILNTYATGMAMLVNASSLSPQKMAAGTRLEDGRGLIYRTVYPVVIPAATSKSAGTVAVKIVASAPGPAYNSSLTNLKGDLSVVAWQGGAKAKIFYGRMTTDVTGGSSGPNMSVASTTLAAASTALLADLSSSAMQSLSNLVPNGYILYQNAANEVFSSTTVTSTGSTTADVSMSATATGFVFNERDLENVLAKDQIAQFPADNYSVNGLDSLIFTPAVGQTFSTKTTSVRFSLSGDIDIVGVIDANSIKSQLLGKPLSVSDSVFSKYSSVIGSAQVSIMPFWIRTIPSSPKKISVIVSTSTNGN